MPHFRAFLIFGLIFTSFLGAFQYDLGVCAIFKDDVNYLPEWIEFHQKQGVEKFWLYNNGRNGKADYEDVLKPYIESGLVSVCEWPHQYADGDHLGWIRIQNGAYFKCINRIKKICKWCAFIDTDEFLFSPEGYSLPDVIKEYDRFGAIAVNWVFYGTSGIECIPSGEKMTDHLVWRANFGRSVDTKCIVKPYLVNSIITAHKFDLKHGYFTVNENMDKMTSTRTEQMSVNRLRINHYYTRDMQYLRERKVPSRRARGVANNLTAEDFDRELNAVFDDCIKKVN